MMPPIIVILLENGDLLIFDSREDAEDYLEAIDVRNNEYTAYDSKGTVLDLSVDDKTERVIIRHPSTKAKSPSALKKSLLKYIGIFDKSANINDLPLRKLVELALKYYRDF